MYDGREIVNVNQTTSYRTSVYENHTSSFQDAPEVFDVDAAWKCGHSVIISGSVNRYISNRMQ